MSDVKKCSKCGEVKSVSDFNKRKSTKDGLAYQCRTCTNVYNQKHSIINRNKTEEEKEIDKIKYKEYCLKNKNRIAENNRIYREKNKLILSEKSKIYCNNNREKINNRSKIDYLKNKAERLQYAKEYAKLNKEMLNEKSRKYNKINSDRIKEYKSENSEMIRVQRRKYFRTRRKLDPLFKLSVNLRIRTIDAFKHSKWNKNNKTKEMLGCDYETALNHIGSLFTDGMNWENHGKWHIDHIIPLSSANSEEELMKLCHYTNLQPLWAIDNFKKGCKMLYNQ